MFNDEYSYIAPTVSDSTEEGIPYYTYKIVAETDSPWSFYSSIPDSGYSVDNLAPEAPEQLMAMSQQASVDLTWGNNIEDDFDFYAVYRSTTSGFEPTEPIGYTSEPMFTDIDPFIDTATYYKVTAFDFNGNQSLASEEVEGFVTTGTSISEGNVYGVWQEVFSPYYVGGDIIVPLGATLTIEPNVKVIFRGPYRFIVYGRLLAQGAESNTVGFSCNKSSGWKGLQFINTNTNGQDGSFVGYCDFSSGIGNGTSDQDKMGGAIYFDNSSDVTLSHLVISGNEAEKGGAIACVNGSSPTITYSLITNNTAGYGGGVYCLDSAPKIVGNTIFSNNAGIEGGGGYIDSSTGFEIVNSIMRSNLPQELIVENSTVSITYSNIEDSGTEPWFGTGCIDSDPGFVDASNSNFNLTWEDFPADNYTKSPCIDTGEADIVYYDSDGTIADMGAFYFNQDIEGFAVSGNVVYDNSIGSLLSGVSINLEKADGTIYYSTTSNLGSYYEFPNVVERTYELTSNYDGEWGSVNATDALVISRHAENLEHLKGLKLSAGDVNDDGVVDLNDNELISSRILGNSTVFEVGDWCFDKYDIEVAGAPVIQNAKALCYGDVNASFDSNTNNLISQISTNPMVVGNGDFMLPISASKESGTIENIGAITFYIKYSKDLQVNDIVSDLSPIRYSCEGTTLKIIYYGLVPHSFSPGTPILLIHFAPFGGGIGPEHTYKFKIGAKSEIADTDAKIISNIVLDVPTVSVSTKANGGRTTLSGNESWEMANSEAISIYPNPAKGTLHFNIPVNQTMPDNIEIINATNQQIEMKFVPTDYSNTIDLGEIAPGTYLIKVNFGHVQIVKKLIVL
jgi:hypothetical protein